MSSLSPLSMNALLAYLIDTREGQTIEIDSPTYDAWAIRQHEGGDREPLRVDGEVVEVSGRKTIVLRAIPVR